MRQNQNRIETEQKTQQQRQQNYHQQEKNTQFNNYSVGRMSMKDEILTYLSDSFEHTLCQSLGHETKASASHTKNND